METGSINAGIEMQSSFKDVLLNNIKYHAVFEIHKRGLINSRVVQRHMNGASESRKANDKD